MIRKDEMQAERDRAVLENSLLPCPSLTRRDLESLMVATAREQAKKLIARNPRFTEAAPSGKGFVIGVR
jgi:hypothetical protein